MRRIRNCLVYKSLTVYEGVSFLLMDIVRVVEIATYYLMLFTYYLVGFYGHRNVHTKCLMKWLRYQRVISLQTQVGISLLWYLLFYLLPTYVFKPTIGEGHEYKGSNIEL
jgi:hypothetical protein